jgi:hypothetical protein
VRCLTLRDSLYSLCSTLCAQLSSPRTTINRYARASGAMLVTSVTTSVAFMMNIFSSVIPIQVFGIQVAFMVMSNYVFVVTYYPAILIVWEWYNIHQWCPWCTPCKKKKVNSIITHCADSCHSLDCSLAGGHSLDLAHFGRGACVCVWGGGS